MQALRELTAALARRGVSVEIARASNLVHPDLGRGAVKGLVGADHLFTSVADAVSAVRRRP
jgi:MFS superfamily sulfate permease-like transporter